MNAQVLFFLYFKFKKRFKVLFVHLSSSIMIDGGVPFAFHK